MIRIDEPMLPARHPVELRAATDRHARRFRRLRRRQATAGLGSTVLLVVLALLTTGTVGPETRLRTTPPAGESSTSTTAFGRSAPASGPAQDGSSPARASTTPDAEPRSGGPASADPSSRAVPSPAPAPAQSRIKLLFTRSTGGLWEATLGTGTLRKVQETSFAGRWSPDGKRIVLETGMGLALLDVESGERTVLFEEDYLEHDTFYRPVWMPDGSSIVFQQSRQTGVTTWATELWTIDTTSRAMRRLRKGAEPSVSRDGRILYSCENSEWCLTDSTGADLGAVPNTMHLYNAVLSPDGRRLVAEKPGGSTFADLIVQRLDGWDRRVLLRDHHVGTPTWFPDSSAVAFDTYPTTHSLEAEPPCTGRPCADDTGIWSVRVDGSDLRPLTDGGGGRDHWPDLVVVP